MKHVAEMGHYLWGDPPTCVEVNTFNVLQEVAVKSNLVSVTTVYSVGGQSYIQSLLTVGIVLKVHGSLCLIICHSMISFVQLSYQPVVKLLN